MSHKGLHPIIPKALRDCALRSQALSQRVRGPQGESSLARTPPSAHVPGKELLLRRRQSLSL